MEKRIFKLKELKTEINAISQKLTSLENDKKLRLKNMPMFAKGATYYTSFIQRIDAQLDSDIQRFEKEVNEQNIMKDTKLKKITEIFDFSSSVL